MKENQADETDAPLPMPEEAKERAPKPTGGPPKDWQHRSLYDNIIKTISTLPSEFTSSIVIRDFRATDIFTLNSALGASIEDAAVAALNKLRELWDPDGTYSLYRFERQSQAFPDVRLVTDAPGQEKILMGIELKGWYVIAKEATPTFRYNITPDACSDQDLIVVFPWVLSDVIAGSPKLLRPFIGEAKHAALYRNYYWETMRAKEGGNGEIVTAKHAEPYPAKADKCSDQAKVDQGNNFGRIARSGLLDAFVEQAEKESVSGIPVKAWVKFFRVFRDGSGDVDEMTEQVERAMASYGVGSEADRDPLIQALGMVIEKLRNAPVVQPIVKRTKATKGTKGTKGTE
jgi:hypothetical protein